MMVRCPTCGTQASLELLVDDQAAGQALQAALEFSSIGPLLIRYLAMFRPAKTKLTWPRVAALLGELLPLVKSERLQRDGQVVEAPLFVWATALEKILAARDAGTLRTPLRSHGYLFEIVVGEAAKVTLQGTVVLHVKQAHPSAKPLSQTAQAIAALQQHKGGA